MIFSTILHAVCLFQVVWTLSRAAADTAASALTSAVASARKAGRVRTARSPAARMTARARGRAWKGSACVTATSEGRTARSRGAPPTARAGACASTGSACVRSLSRGRTAWSGGAWTTARTRAPASTGRASAGPATSGRTARWCTVPTTAARRGSARTASVSARTALLETTATQVDVSLFFISFFYALCELDPLSCLQRQDRSSLVWIVNSEKQTARTRHPHLTLAVSLTFGNPAQKRNLLTDFRMTRREPPTVSFELLRGNKFLFKWELRHKIEHLH